MYSIRIGETVFWSSMMNDPRYSLDDPTVKKELGGSGSMEFSMLQTHPFYDEIQTMQTVMTAWQDDQLLFKGRVLETSTNFEGKRSVTFEGTMGYLNDTYQEPRSETVTPRQHFVNLIEEHNRQCETYKRFTVGRVEVNEPAGEKAFNNTSFRSTMNAIENDLTSPYGAYIQVRTENGVDYLDLLTKPDDDFGDDISFGWNLLDISYDDTSDKLFTVLVPLGKNNLTVASVNDGSQEIVIEELYERYGYIAKTENFSDVKDPQVLKEKAEIFIEDNYPTVLMPDISVSALDFSTLGYNSKHYDIGQRIWITSTPHGIDEEMVLKSATIHMASPDENEYTFGDPHIAAKSGSNGTLTSRTAKSAGGGGFGAGTPWYNKYFSPLTNGMEIIAQQLGINLMGGDMVIKDGTVTYDQISKLDALFAPYVESGATNSELAGLIRTYSYKEQRRATVLGQYFNLVEELAKPNSENQNWNDLSDKIFGKDFDWEDANVAFKEHFSAHTATAKEQKWTYTRAVELGEKTEDMSNAIEKNTTEIRQNADSITLNAAATKKNADDLAAYIKVAADQIESKVSAGDVASVINQTPQSVRISASKINLDGYVTATELDAVRANIVNLTTGVTKATSLSATMLNADQFSIADHTMARKSLSMGNVLSATVLADSGQYAGIDLSHSHKVVVNDDGTITLGEVATEGGSFKIADTQAYKDGVSAAARNVTINKADYWVNDVLKISATNGRTLDVRLPAITLNIPNWSSENKATATVTIPNRNGQFLVRSSTIDASSVYTKGVNAAKDKYTASALNIGGTDYTGDTVQTLYARGTSHSMVSRGQIGPYTSVTLTNGGSTPQYLYYFWSTQNLTTTTFYEVSSRSIKYTASKLDI